VGVAEPAVFTAVTDERGRIVPDYPAQYAALMRRRFPAGTCIEFEVREQATKRSDRQNRALWALLSPWARERGWQVDELKDVMLGIAFGKVEQTQPVTGAIVQVNAKPRSSKLSVHDFCHLIEEVLRVAAEDDYWLEAPDEYRKAKEQAQRKAAKAA
jgi:hypothetical protein